MRQGIPCLNPEYYMQDFVFAYELKNNHVSLIYGKYNYSCHSINSSQDAFHQVFPSIGIK